MKLFDLQGWKQWINEGGFGDTSLLAKVCRIFMLICTVAPLVGLIAFVYAALSSAEGSSSLPFSTADYDFAEHYIIYSADRVETNSHPFTWRNPATGTAGAIYFISDFDDERCREFTNKMYLENSPDPNAEYTGKVCLGENPKIIYRLP